MGCEPFWLHVGALFLAPQCQKIWAPFLFGVGSPIIINPTHTAGITPNIIIIAHTCCCVNDISRYLNFKKVVLVGFVKLNYDYKLAPRFFLLKMGDNFAGFAAPYLLKLLG